MSVLIGIIAAVVAEFATANKANSTAEDPAESIRKNCTLPEDVTGYNLENCSTSSGGPAEDVCMVSCKEGFMFEDMQQPTCSGSSCELVSISNQRGLWVVSRGSSGYGNAESARISLWGPGVVKFLTMGTEAAYDVLTLQGMRFSGSALPPDLTLSDGMHTIDWSSDDNAAGTGWTISFRPKSQRQGKCAAVPGSIGVLSLPGPCAMACSLPEQPPDGCDVSGCNTSAGPLPSSACRVACTPGLVFADSGPVVRNGECSSPQGVFALPSPCVEAACTLPSEHVGYNVSACDTSVSAQPENDCDVSCLPGFSFQDERPPSCRGWSCSLIRITRGEQLWTVSRGVSQYGDEESAEISLSGPGMLRFSFFDTEEHHDTLSIHGISYSGSIAPAGMALSAGVHTLRWVSDGSLAGKGWTFVFQQNATRKAACLPGGVFSLPGPCIRACKLPAGMHGFNTTDCDTSLQALPDGACKLTCASGYSMEGSSTLELHPKCTDHGIFELRSKCVAGRKVARCKLPNPLAGYNVSRCNTSSGLLSEDACLVECLTGYTFLEEGPTARHGKCPAPEGIFSLPSRCVEIVRSWSAAEVLSLKSILQELNLFPSGVEPCSWRGVHCLPDRAHYLLSVSGERLGGTLGRAIGQLQRMRELHISGHSLKGTLPTELGNLTRLARLELDNNELTGSIPAEITSLSLLKTLSLSHCRLTGRLPQQIGLLSSLEILQLHGHRLQGPLPESLGGLQSLRRMHLQSNRLQSTIPSDIGSLTRLRVLDLEENHISGSLPSSLGNLTSLQVLRLTGNDLHGELPDLSGLLHLRALEAGSNFFTSVSWGADDAAHHSLALLNLSRNRLNGILWLPWASLPKLELMDISWNGQLAWPLSTYSRRLQRHACQEEGSLGLPPFTRLRSLDVSGNTWYINDSLQSKQQNLSAMELVQSLAHLPGLVELRAARCSLWGPVTLALGTLASDPENSVRTDDCIYHASQAKNAFASLSFLDLSSNNITAVDAPPSPLLAAASFRDNALTKLDHAWWYAPQTEGRRLQSLDLRQNIALRTAVEIAETCAAAGDSLLVDPGSFSTLIRQDLGYECSRICCAARLMLETSVNSSLCRCLPGWEGHGRECRKCQADSYADRTSYPDGFRSQCMPCPEHSTTLGIDGCSSAEACQCNPGFHKESSAAGKLSCRRCPRFATTAAEGATSIEDCICDSEAFHALHSYGTLCGCSDKNFMNQMHSRCQKCSEGEDCQWQGNATRSVMRPRIKSGFWASYHEEVADRYITTFQRTGCPNPAPKTNWWTRASDQEVWEGMYEICTLTLSGKANQRQRSQCCGSLQGCKPVCEQQSAWAMEAIGFGGHSVYRCFSWRTCLGEGRCAADRHGFACAECEAGTYGGLDGPCKSCADVFAHGQTYVAFLGLLSVPVLLLLLRIDSSRLSAVPVRAESQVYQKLRAAIRVFVQHVQLMCVISAFYVSWPDSTAWLWSTLQIFTFGADLPFVCAASPREGGAIISLVCKLLLPIMMLLITVLSTLSLNAFRIISIYLRVENLKSLASKCVVTIADVLQFNYMLWSACFATVMQTSFSLFACRDSPNSKTMSVALPHIKCFSASWWQLFPGALLAILAYVVTYVACTAWLLRFEGSVLKSAGAHHVLAFEGLRAVHAQWPLHTVARDIAVNIILIVFANSGTAQILLTTAVVAMYGFAIAWKHPFLDKTVSLLELVCVISVLTVLIATAGLGFQRSVGYSSIEDMLEEGRAADAFVSRAAVLLLVQVLAILLPFFILIYVCLQSLPCATRCFPWCFRGSQRLPPEQRLNHIREQIRDIEALRCLCASMDDYEWSRFESYLYSAAKTSAERRNATNGSAAQFSSWLPGLTGVLPARNVSLPGSSEDYCNDSRVLQDWCAPSPEAPGPENESAADELSTPVTESSAQPETLATPVWLEVLTEEDVTFSVSEFVWTAPDDIMSSTAMSDYRSAPRQMVSASSRPAFLANKHYLQCEHGSESESTEPKQTF